MKRQVEGKSTYRLLAVIFKKNYIYFIVCAYFHQFFFSNSFRHNLMLTVIITFQQRKNIVNQFNKTKNCIVNDLGLPYYRPTRNDASRPSEKYTSATLYRGHFQTCRRTQTFLADLSFLG